MSSSVKWMKTTFKTSSTWANSSLQTGAVHDPWPRTRWWIRGEPKPKWFHRTGGRNAVWYDPCALYQWQIEELHRWLRNGSKGTWILSKSLLWESTPIGVWCTWGGYGETLLPEVSGRLHTQVFPPPSHRWGLLWHQVPTHAVYGAPRISTKEDTLIFYLFILIFDFWRTELCLHITSILNYFFDWFEVVVGDL